MDDLERAVRLWKEIAETGSANQVDRVLLIGAALIAVAREIRNARS